MAATDPHVDVPLGSMFHRSLLLLFTVGLLGCGESRSPENNTPPAGSGATRPMTSWAMNTAGMAYPDHPATGRLRGKSFTPDTFALQNGILTLSKGSEFRSDQQIMVFLFLNEKSPVGKSWAIGKGGQHTALKPHIHATWQEGGKPKTKVYTDDYALKLEFDQPQERSLTGRIYLCLPDQAKSYVSGTFRTQLPPDYAKPPLASESPFIHGAIHLKGGKEFKLLAGYVGFKPDGKRLINLAGSTVQPGSRTRVTATTFKPRITSLINDKAHGCSYRHVRLEPGWYLVYVRWDDRYCDWRWTEVKPDSQLKINFTIDSKTKANLQVRVGKQDAKRFVELTPLNDQNELPPLKQALQASIPYSLGLRIKPENDMAEFIGLRAGPYRVVVGDKSKVIQLKPGDTTVNIE